jgi:glycosyltransferase involved in cell wall biosynthesis
MKILVDARALQSWRGGISSYLRNIINNIDDSVKPHVVLVANKELEISATNNITVYIDKFYSFLPGFVWAALRLNRLAKELECDLVFLPESIGPVFFCSKLKYVPVVHDLVAYDFPKTMSLLVWILHRLLLLRTFERSFFCISISFFSRDRAKYWLLRKKRSVPSFSVIYHGASIYDEITLSKPLQNRKAVFVGSLEPRKNIENLVNSFLRSKFCNSGGQLHIYYKNSWGDSLSNIKKILLNNNSVVLHFGKSTEDLLFAVDSSCALIVPSLYEGFCLPLFEFANRTTIIANNIPIFRELSKYFDGLILIDFNQTTNLIADYLDSILMEPRYSINVTLLKFTPDYPYDWKRCSNLTFASLLDK